jgi:tetratricopeptide (TPR) repeat protein
MRANTPAAIKASAAKFAALASLAVLTGLLATIATLPATAQAGRQPPSANTALQVPPAVQQGLEEIFDGNPDAALDSAHKLEQAAPDSPLGYLLEGEARWWKLYCSTDEVRWGMVDAWQLPKQPEDKAYLDATEKAVHLAENQLKTNASAQANLYTGIGYALEARLYGLRDESLATARAGVRARSHFLKALQLDPQLADADTGLGLYNYYVATLSPVVKVLRVFLGIPGGSKSQGIAQLQIAMSQGRLTALEARFYLARNLRTYDLDYAQAKSLAQPLALQHPHNPIFLLLLANLEIELGERQQAATELGRVEQLEIPDAACAQRVRRLAGQLLDSLR